MTLQGMPYISGTGNPVCPISVVSIYLFKVYLNRGRNKNIDRLEQSSDVCIIVFLARANSQHLREGMSMGLRSLMVQDKH